MKYIENEYTYYVKYTDFYSKFEIYRQTMRPSSKIQLAVVEAA